MFFFFLSLLWFKHQYSIVHKMGINNAKFRFVLFCFILFFLFCLFWVGFCLFFQYLLIQVSSIKVISFQMIYQRKKKVLLFLNDLLFFWFVFWLIVSELTHCVHNVLFICVCLLFIVYWFCLVCLLCLCCDDCDNNIISLANVFHFLFFAFFFIVIW